MNETCKKYSYGHEQYFTKEQNLLDGQTSEAVPSLVESLSHSVRSSVKSAEKGTRNGPRI